MTLIFLILVSSFSAFAQESEVLLRQEVAKESSRVIKVFKKPTKESRYEMEYYFDEVNVRPKEIVYFKVPEFYSKHFIDNITIGHRQDEKPQQRDPNPAYSRMLVLSHEMGARNYWRFWGGSFSGRSGAKFAEQGRWPELDNLYEWPKKGHYIFGQNKKARSLVKPKVIKIENVGTDSLLLSTLILNTLESDSRVRNSYETTIFSGRSNFGDPLTMAGRFYDGGQRHRGKFPGALRLSKNNGRSWSGLPMGWKLNRNKVEIPLYNGQSGKTLTKVEIMCGDTKPDEVRNRDGGWGSLGNAKVTTKIYSPTRDKLYSVGKNKNVPPEGVVTSSTPRNYQGRPGDRLIIESRLNSADLYIMGIRLSYE